MGAFGGTRRLSRRQTNDQASKPKPISRAELKFRIQSPRAVSQQTFGSSQDARCSTRCPDEAPQRFPRVLHFGHNQVRLALARVQPRSRCAAPLSARGWAQVGRKLPFVPSIGRPRCARTDLDHRLDCSRPSVFGCAQSRATWGSGCFLSRGCLPARVQLWPRRASVRLSKSSAFARDGRPDRRKTLLGQISAATLYLRFCQKQRNLMCRPTICRRPVGRACFNPMQTPTLRRLAAHPGTPMAARH